jgi:hypothetical protein
MVAQGAKLVGHIGAENMDIRTGAKRSLYAAGGGCVAAIYQHFFAFDVEENREVVHIWRFQYYL